MPLMLRPEERSAPVAFHSRIDDSRDPETGAPRLRVIFPNNDAPEIYELSCLLAHEELALFLAEGFNHWAASVSPPTRDKRLRELTRGIGTFLMSLDQKVTPTSIDEAFWTSFVVWLNGPRHRSGKTWAPATRAKTLNAVKICISALLDHPVHGAAATTIMDQSGFPHNSWPGRSRKSVPTKVLSPTERQAMIFACLSEIAVTREHLLEREAILATGRALLEDAQSEGRAPPYYSEVGACAARIEQSFPDRLALPKDLHLLEPALGRAVAYKHGMIPTRRLLYATFRDLVPFVILIGTKTAFNSDTVLSLKWSQVRTSRDKKTITFLGIKNRASDLQVSMTEAGTALDHDFAAEPGVPFAFADLLDMLRELTERTRHILSDPSQADRLFVGIPAWGSQTVKSYDHKNGPSSDEAWKYSLQKFVNDHGLKPFSLQTVRFTEGESEWRRTGDLLAVRDRLGHTHIATTRTHYTSDGMRRDSQLRVAETQAFYHRWARTEGRIDPRQQPEKCRSAATPGFGCLDPFNSPRPGQSKGKLCTAYGECADCPLAQAWPHNVQAAAYYLALPKAINDARLGRMSPRHWAQKWPPILNAHNHLLDEIPSEIRANASRLHVKLKPVG
ncbi:hypothetical protein [Aurantiacibacter suaedae]|uniref:hypothetical protein n=1 Tax=Aurantiacibacter suaedae TaxID=2545755 RepID=UPI0010F76C63|nr:hypothetical protein [Aurantiacibacter suaedae]